MAVIVLAEYSGQAWLVRGEQHIDHLLANTLPGDISIEVVPCESKSAVDALWRMYDGAASDESMMWLIHPAIVNRVRGKPAGMSIAFTAWSASLDAAALVVLQEAADALAGGTDATLTLVRHVAADAPAMATDLANLRSGLLEAQLVARGVTEVCRETREPEDAADADRIDLVVRPA